VGVCCHRVDGVAHCRRSCPVPRAQRTSLRDLLPVWRKYFGRYYPTVALIGVAELVDPAAKIELVCTAVIPG
jgi:enamine deaminase RidA (YjgF/YER057c/UK114 family)